MTAREYRLSVGKDSVSALWLRPRGAEAVLALAHGAGAGMHHPFMATLADNLAAHGVATLRYQFPYMEAGRRFPDRSPKLMAAVRAAVGFAARRAGDLPLLAGGKSLGGRMTSLAAAAEPLAGVAGLVFFGFPLHRPRQPATERSEHLSRVSTPMLFLQGSRDTLAELELLTPLCRGLGRAATLHVIDGADHGFGMLKRSGRTPEDVLMELAATTRTWIQRRTQ